MARPVVILTILSEGQGGRVVWEEQQNCQIDLWVREKSLIKWWFHKKMWKALFVRVYVWLRFYTWFGRIRYVSIQYSHRVIELYIGRCYCQCKDVFREHHDFSFVFNTARAGEDILICGCIQSIVWLTYFRSSLIAVRIASCLFRAEFQFSTVHILNWARDASMRFAPYSNDHIIYILMYI